MSAPYTVESKLGLRPATTSNALLSAPIRRRFAAPEAGGRAHHVFTGPAASDTPDLDSRCAILASATGRSSPSHGKCGKAESS